MRGEKIQNQKEATWDIQCRCPASLWGLKPSQLPTMGCLQIGDLIDAYCVNMVATPMMVTQSDVTFLPVTCKGVCAWDMHPL